MEEPKSELSPRLRHSLEALSKRIRELRERQGLTQEDFARKCGISTSFASLLERGERTPSYETLIQASEALGVSLGELFQDASAQALDNSGHFKLLRFVRARRLSGAQIERWIAVGEVMFEQPKAPSPSPGPSCSHAGCRRPVLAKGLCVAHYHRIRRAKR